jgi:hypothetical protein
VTVAFSDENADDLTAQPVYVDLVEETQAVASISLDRKIGSDLQGRLVDDTGRPVPFGWLAEINGGYVGQVSPLDGRFNLTDSDGEEKLLQVKAPGFWSQLVELAAGENPEITLQPHSNQQTLSWGNGQLIVPAESVIVETNDALSLIRGWIWGINDQPDLFTINLEGALLEVQAADFALEVTPGDVSWLFVNDGQASFTSREGVTWQINPGEMMAFGDGVPVPNPVAADDLVVTLLREGRQPVTQLLYQPEPTTAQSLGDNLAKFVSSLSQGIVAGTYFLMFLAIVGTVLFALRRLLFSRS